MTVLAQQLVLGLLLGGLYGLAAAGLSLVFGVLKVLNVAHGELIMLGGYGAFWLFALAGLDPFVSLLLVIPGSLLLGVVLYLVLFGFVVRAARGDADQELAADRLRPGAGAARPRGAAVDRRRALDHHPGYGGA